MRRIKDFNDNWYFSKTAEIPVSLPADWQPVTLPHTWNARDGQDGGNDYWRGTAVYARSFRHPDLGNGERAYLEFEGAAMTAEVFLNGSKLTRHEGGYSTFRVDITDMLREENLLCVSVDNSANDTVYPQKADFTFYGGIYRPVRLIIVPEVHFSLDQHGGPGIRVTPVTDIREKTSEVTVETWITGDAGHVQFQLDGQVMAVPVESHCARAVFTLSPVHLWDGISDPWLYTVTAILPGGDSISADFGCRTIAFDAEKGFLLNDRPYRLCGAARHQDRLGMGNALTGKEHEEDMALMREMGANTVRLAHYQHAGYFYDLCDRYGMIVWAEIPYITRHMENGRANTFSQMTELIVQNYNHPSIVCWGLSNEITASGGVTNDMVENHRILNDLCHSLDRTRPTAMAHAFMLDMDDPFVRLSDIRSYNLYYGWYLGELEQNDQWFDEFHRKHPDTVIGLSEYGADANPAYQNGSPEKGDWSEPYQALYHEHMLKMWSERPYIWAMHCWNMFDFAADGRNEGGKPGQNQKGLVTFDRKVRKDAFYIYKAYLSPEPFVHICGRRYINRAEAETEVKVYSNTPEVTLYVDGKAFETQKSDKIFRFRIPISGEHSIEARSGSLTDSIVIRRTDKPDPSYRAEGTEVVNWFDRPDEIIREGYYSILDAMSEIRKSPAGAALLDRMMEKVTASYGDVAKSVTLPEAVQRQMDRMPLEKLLKQAGNAVTPAMVKQLNSALNQIPKA
ncbi:MAG TPA: glycoside hydrolase family 2 protein [Candidatus Mediterraneibacter cottocaccae]|nr:glycoside hydrolase family 2 protein [Candidatus Mediterraneibacter cottocaccae]